MTENLRKILLLSAVMLLVLPMAYLLAAPEAEARPGSILRESRQDRDRSHSRARRTSRDDDSRSERSRSSRRSSSNANRSSNTNRSTQNARPTGPPRSTGNIRPATPQSVRSDHRPATRNRRTTIRRAPTSRVHVHRSATVVHHHHHSHRDTHHSHHTHREVHHDEAALQGSETNNNPFAHLDGFFTVGAGMSGFASSGISNAALPGTDFNLGLGVSGRLFGFELGFHGGVFTFEPDAQSIDIVLMGITGDLKLQPSIGIIEPFVLAGIGSYHLQDAYLNEAAVGAGGRVGAGVDLRLSNFAISLRYLRNYYGFFNERSFSDGLGAQGESMGVNFSFYF